VDLQGDPGRDELVLQVQPVGLLLGEDQGQPFVFPDHDDGIGAGRYARVTFV